MHLMLRLPLLSALLLVAETPFALAESPLTDPVPPAVIGRPLDQIRPVRPERQKPAAKPTRSRQAAARPAAPAKVARPATATATGTATATASGTATATGKATAPGKVTAAAKATAAGTATATMGAAASRPARQAADDRPDPGTRSDDVGKGTNFARKPLGPGAYFADKHRSAVHKYYEAHPAPGKPLGWKIGEPVPQGASVSAVPAGLLGSLPKLPPGHRYVQLGGEVVLMAAESKMIVDGISRRSR